MKLKIYLICCFTLVSAHLCAQDAFVHLKNDTLSIISPSLKLNFKWNNGNPKALSARTENIRIQIDSTRHKPLTDVGNCLSTPDSGSVTWQVIQATPRVASHLYVRTDGFCENYSIVRHWFISLTLPALETYVELKGAHQGSSKSQLEKAMIEGKSPQTETKTYIDHYPFAPEHFTLTVAAFADATDHHSNPVTETNYQAFSRLQAVTGNFFLLNDHQNKETHAVIKRSPAGNSQPDFPGNDAQFAQGAFQLIPPKHADKTSLTGYPVIWVLGVANEQAARTIARKFELERFRYIPETDDTFTMNTWGDRNRDARVTESFILNELVAAKKLGITHYQIDDGWQAGLSKNSNQTGNNKWESWTENDWAPHAERFPNGLKSVCEKAESLDMKIGLWYNPGADSSYVNELHERVIGGLYHKHGIHTFKIDGVEIKSRQNLAELDTLFQTLADTTNGKLVLNLDVTAGNRGGYFALNRHGSLFLENRYTDWGNYYPHLTLRNLWLLSKYLPAQRLQIPFLNPWRNVDKYGNNPLAPVNYEFDYLFATTLMAQPLAWFEATQLPQEAFELTQLVEQWQSVRHIIATGIVEPIGSEPNGYSITGFRCDSPHGTLLLVFRENGEEEELKIQNLKEQEIVNLHKSENVFAEFNKNDLIIKLNSKRSFALLQLNK